MLFRTEEIVDASTAALKDQRRGRLDLGQLALFKLHPDALSAVRAGILNDYRIVLMGAVDQQQEVNRSSHFKLVVAVHLHLMGEEIDKAGEASWILRINPVQRVCFRPLWGDHSKS